MRSKPKRRLLLASALVWALSCSSTRERRIFDICETLHVCAGYLDVEQCEVTIKDAIDDRRVTDSETARCSQCLGDHYTGAGGAGSSANEQESCDDVLIQRDCDAACQGVSLALRTRTNETMRDEMCNAFSKVCGTEGIAKECRHAWREEFKALKLAAQLDLDERVLACHDCIVAPGMALVEDDPSGLAGCQVLVNACRESCRQVGAVKLVLEPADNVVTICRHDESCFSAAGGAPGTAMPSVAEGGAGPSCKERLLDGVEASLDKLAIASGGASGADAGGASGADAGGASGAEGAEPRLLSLEKLATCAVCVDSLPCDSIGLNCQDKCSGVYP